MDIKGVKANQNETVNSSKLYLFNENNSEKEDIEEDENESPILRKEIRATITKPYVELVMSEQKNFNYIIIRFDLDFYSKEGKYFWKVYHTPKEIRNHIQKIINKINQQNLSVTKPIHPLIFQLKRDNDVINNIQIVTDFYIQLFNEPKFKSNKTLTKFFNISANSFLRQNGGIKPFEGYVEKKADKGCCRKCFMVICPFWEFALFKRYNKRWIVVYDDHLFYLNKPYLKEGKVVYFFDRDMEIKYDGEDCLKVKNASMSLYLQFKSFFEREIWKNELEKRYQKYKLLLEKNKYSSYSNMKGYNLCQWFIDGKDYFEDLYKMLMSAKNYIYITDWWMSPELFLLRPVNEKIYLDMAKNKVISRDLGKNMTRLIDILDYKARQGVKIYILIYYEVSVASTLDSKHTVEIFNKINKNIKITRHPEASKTLLWSHHEKLVIIDHIIGYVGGLDLCWGRYDTNKHPIYEGPNQEGIYEFPLIDYSNARITDFMNVKEYTIESVSRKDNVRMPWHDVHSRIIGPAVSDILRHFIERWNYANFEDRKNRGITSVHQGASFSQNKFDFWKVFTKTLKKNNIKNKNKENPINRLQTVETIILDDKKIGKEIDTKISKDLYVRDNSQIVSTNTKVDKQKSNTYKNLVKSLGKMGSKAIEFDEENEIYENYFYKQYFKPGCIMSKVQVLRSASQWSAGLRKTENSI